MCDYSLHSVRSRPAEIGDKLVMKDFGTGTRGFASVTDASTAVRDQIAVFAHDQGIPDRDAGFGARARQFGGCVPRERMNYRGLAAV